MEEGAAPDGVGFTLAPSLTLDDVGPRLAQARYRLAADGLARANRNCSARISSGGPYLRLPVGLHGCTRLMLVGDANRARHEA